MRIKIPAVLKLISIAVFIAAGFFFGFLFGAGQTLQTARLRESAILEDFQRTLASLTQPTPTPTPTTRNSQPIQLRQPARYTGPELWEAVNKARIEHGVNPLSQRDILCTIAAIRLSQIRELGKLDGHDGFQGVYDKYKDDSNMPNNVAEFLISGYPTPDQAVSAWLDTLGHKKLITGGEYKWGCIYAQDGFSVAITGF